MDYLKIFDEIVDIMHNDYSGCNDKRGWDKPEFYRLQMITLKNQNRLNKRRFCGLIEEYLLAFKDYHVGFMCKGLKSRYYGIKTCRCDDKLYITKSIADGFEAGDAIVKLGGDGILAAREKYDAYFFEPDATRENWFSVIHKYRVCTLLKKSGEIQKVTFKNLDLKAAALKSEPPYSAKKMNENTLYIKLRDFESEAGVKSLIDQNLADFESSQSLIIDVRKNNGGFDMAYFPLLPYIFPAESSESPLAAASDYGYSVNYSKRNCKGRLKLFLEHFKDFDAQSQAVLQTEIDKVKANSGKGFVPEDGGEETKIEGRELPLKVIVLSDVDCGSSGDSFVEACKLSKKVTVIGRPTLGSTDYSNLNIEKIGEFEFYYSTSRDGRIDFGQGLNGKGVQPHIYIPWTKEHLEKDVDLEYALEFLSKK